MILKRSFLLFVLAALSCSNAGPHADLILRGGRVYTVDAGRPWAEAVAVRGDTLLAVGSNTEMDRFIGQDTSVVELDGRLVLPGFIDSHLHFLDGSIGLDRILLHDASSLEDIQDIVRVYADNHPERPWILGTGWIYSHIRNGELPTRHDLDEVVPDRLVFLEAYDGHTGWANSKALEIAGIDRESQPEGYGEIVMDPVTGEPTGALKEDGAMSRVRRAIPTPSREQRFEALRRGIAYAHRFGVTSVHTAGGSPDADAPSWGDYLDLFEELEANGELALRVYFSMAVDKETTDEDLERFSRIKARLPGPWVRAGAVKVFMDGVIESHTAAMLEPYSDDPTALGSTEHSREAIDELVSRIDRHDLQIFTHAIGDRAVRMVLDAYEKLSTTGRRHRIEHIEVLSESDMPRFASLEVIASMQPQHASPEITEVWARSVGRGRAERGFAWKSLTLTGARLALGSDWPVVDLDPLLGIYTAVTREDLRGRPEGGWIPDERLSLEEAIHGYTLGGAYASFEETVKGSVEPGKLADLVVLTDDLFKIPYPRIPHTEAAMTVIGGKVVFISPSFLPQELRENLLGRESQ